MELGARVQRTAAVLAVFVSAMIIAGCVDSEVSDPQVQITVLDAARDPGQCPLADDNESCHKLRVQVVNNNEEEDVSNNRFYWEAVTDDGSVYDVEDKEGPDKITAGSEAEVRLWFAPQRGQNLTTLRYEAVWMSEPVTASVPSY